jgi:transposase
MESTHKRRQFDKQFKLDTVRLVTDGGRTAADVARDLGVDPNTIYNWKREYSDHGNAAFPGKGRLIAEDDQLRQLKRDNQRLAEENAVLKKAIGYFTKHGK